MPRSATSRRPKTEIELRNTRSEIEVIETEVSPRYQDNPSAMKMIANLQALKERKAANRQQELAGADAFAARLRHLREQRGLTQAELAKSAGIGQAMISLLEKGDRMPNWKTVCKLAETLDVGIEEFR